jgi:hypothetical protein
VVVTGAEKQGYHSAEGEKRSVSDRRFTACGKTFA